MACERAKGSSKSRARYAGVAPVVAGTLLGAVMVMGMRGEEAPVRSTPRQPPAISIALPKITAGPKSTLDRGAEHHLLRIAISLPAHTVYERVPVPRRRPNRWRLHQGEQASFPQAPKVAIIIDDMGLNAARSARVVSLAGPLTLSYLPYANSLQRQTAIARAAGHELLVHVPMEPKITAVEPGPNVLELGMSAGENLRRLDWALTRFDGFVGINNHMGSRFTPDEESMWPILRELKRRGLLFVDSLTDRRSAAGQIASSIGLPFSKRDVFLDHIDDDAAIRRRFKELEKIARQNGAAVAIGHPRDATIAALKNWIPKARASGFDLVPISRIVEERRERLMVAPTAPDHGEGPA